MIGKTLKQFTTMGLVVLLLSLAFVSLGSITGEVLAAPSPSGHHIPAANSISATLHLVKQGPGTATTGEVITYTLTYSNSGPYTATSVLITDTLPVSVTYAGSSPVISGSVGRKIWWQIGELGPTETGTITLRVTATVTGTVTNTAVITADPGAQGGEASHTTIVAGAGPVTSTLYLPIVLKPDSMTTLFIIADNTGGINSVIVYKTDGVTELCACGPFVDNPNEQPCGKFEPQPYKVVAETVRCGTLSGVFNDAEPGKNIVRTIRCF